MTTRRRLGRSLACVLALGLIGGCSDDGWERKEIGFVQVEGDQLIVGPHCSDHARVRVDERDDQVRLGFEVRGVHQGDCYDTAIVELDAPLGERDLVDDETGQPVRVGSHP